MDQKNAASFKRISPRLNQRFPNDIFGVPLAISGDTMVVGAYQEDSGASVINGNQSDNSATNAGAAYVFVRIGTNWLQQAYLKPSNPNAFDTFGVSVAISGDTIVIGAIEEDSNATGVNGDGNNNGRTAAGAAYVFVRTGTTWSQQAYLKASNTGSGDLFGCSVAISGDTVVVGSLYEDSNAVGVNGDQSNNSAPNSGAAYVFVRDETNWSQQAYLKASNTRPGGQFGCSIAISGETILVGAYGDSSGAAGVNGNQSDTSMPSAGAAYVFARNGTIWNQQAFLKASNPGSADWFGLFVAISGDTAVVGSPFEDSGAAGVNSDGNDNSAKDSGAAYVYKRNGTSWTVQAYLKASNPTGGPAGSVFGGDNFGVVTIEGDIIAVGAIGESSSATGVNGNQLNEGATNSGAVYVFARSDTNWTQKAYLKASNTGVNDSFGRSLGFSSDTLVVGSPGESSNATGVNGDQENNLILASGAVYVFTGVMAAPRLAILPDGGGGYFLRFTATPQTNFRVERAPIPTGQWNMVATLIAPDSGLLEYHDTAPPDSQAFYRVVQP